MPGLVELGLVERREVPPSSQFRLVREHVAAQAIVALADARSGALRAIGGAAATIVPEPVSVIVFGSFARGQADSRNDIDLLVVRSDDVDDEDERWAESLEAWRLLVRLITGNDVEVVDASESEVTHKLQNRSGLWNDIRRDGIVVHGTVLDDLTERASA